MSDPHIFTEGAGHRHSAQSLLDTASEPLALINQQGRIVWRHPDFRAETSRRLQDKAKFLAVASHDLRGVLANVRSYASLLLSTRYGLEGRARQSMEVILRNTDRALGLLRDVFDSLRHEVGAMPIHKEWSPLAPCLRDAVNRVQSAFQEQGVQILREFPDELPQLEIDPERIAHAVQAMLLHALTRAPPSSEVCLRAGSNGHQVYVEVEDGGPPLTPSQEAEAFQRDARVAADHHLAEGFVLCVAGAEIEAHGGECGVDQAEGRTTFYFRLPRSPEGPPRPG